MMSNEVLLHAVATTAEVAAAVTEIEIVAEGQLKDPQLLSEPS